jgi:hypothetical protein
MRDVSEVAAVREWLAERRQSVEPLRIEIRQRDDGGWKAKAVGIDGAEAERTSLTAAVITASAEALQELGRELLRLDPDAIKSRIGLFELVVVEPEE